jgi:hypothetical protein
MVSVFLSLLEYAEYSDSLPSVRASDSTRSAEGSPRQPRMNHNREAGGVVLLVPSPSAVGNSACPDPAGLFGQAAWVKSRWVRWLDRVRSRGWPVQ